jgi:hypothetical protein
MNGENEERLRMALQRESERIEVSPDLRRRLNARMGRGGSYLRSRALAASVAVVVVAVGVAVWLIAGRGPVKESLIAPPGEDTYFAGYWPVSTRAEAEAIQRRVDDGEETWRREPASVAKAYGESLGWTVAEGVDNPETTGDLAEGYTETTIAPMIGEGTNKIAGAQHRVLMVSLEGADQSAWFVAGITSDNISVDEPRPGATITSPVRVAGRGVSYEGNILGAVVRDEPNPDAHGAFSGQPIQAGATEPMPFEATLSFPRPDVPAGIVHLQGSSGLEGPSTDVTIVRVRFAATSLSTTAPTPSQEAADEEAAADDAFRCFINARHSRDLEAAKPCMTQRYADSISDPVEFIGPSSPSVERATIISSARDGQRVVYDALVYWGSSTGLQFVSEDTVTVVLDGGEALVDSWTQGTQEPIGETTTVTLSFLAPGDTPRCNGGAIAEGSFTTIERVVPREVVVDDLALSVVREVVTGHWAHEGDGDNLFPNGTRVERVSVDGDGVATVELNRLPDQDPCEFAGEALGQTLLRLDGITNMQLREAAPQTPSEPDV